MRHQPLFSANIALMLSAFLVSSASLYEHCPLTSARYINLSCVALVFFDSFPFLHVFFSPFSHIFFFLLLTPFKNRLLFLISAVASQQKWAAGTEILHLPSAHPAMLSCLCSNHCLPGCSVDYSRRDCSNSLSSRGSQSLPSTLLLLCIQWLWR